MHPARKPVGGVVLLSLLLLHEHILIRLFAFVERVTEEKRILASFFLTSRMWYYGVGAG